MLGQVKLALRVALRRMAIDLAVRGHREGRYRRALAVLDEQAGGAYVGDRQPDLPLVELLHGRRLVTVADAVDGVGDHAADVGEVAVPHDRGGLAGRRGGDPGEQLGGGGGGRGLGRFRGGRAGMRPHGGGGRYGHRRRREDGPRDEDRAGDGLAAWRLAPGPGLARVGLAEFGHQVLLQDLLPGRRQVPFGRQPPGHVVKVHRVPPTRSPVTCSLAGPGSRCSFRRARDSRERTVPTGTPSASAASA